MRVNFSAHRRCLPVWRRLSRIRKFLRARYACRDIAEAGLIAENDERIPHSGYLYVFLDTAEYPYRARVLHCVEEPAIAMDDFNAEVAGAEHLTDDWLMEFSPAEETAEGISPFGAAHGLAVCGGTAACVHAV